MIRDPRIVVMHLITSLGTGGAERMLARLAEHLDPHRFRTLVVSIQGDGPMAQPLRDANAEVLSLDVRRARDLPAGLARLKRLLLRRRPDILQTWLYHADLVGLLVGKAAAMPCILWNVRCTVIAEGTPRTLSEYLPHVLARLSCLPTATVVNSESGLRVHEGYGYRCRDWRVIPNGFDTTEFRPLPEMRDAMRLSLGIPAEAPVVGMLARFHPHKDHDTFLEAARLTRERIPNVRFVLAGTNITKDSELGRRVARLSLGDCVQLLGERTDIPQVVSAFDISTLSSWTESFPNAIGESMACAVPCVVTDVGDSSVLVGNTGTVVSARDPQALSQGWIGLLTISPEARRTLGESARQRIIDDFGLPRAVAMYQGLYEELYARAPTRKATRAEGRTR